MEELKNQVDKKRLPKHIAVIMDGNGRWAKGKGKNRIFGHQNGVEAVRDTVEASAELGVGFLTLYAFSTENWNRPKFEVNALMRLLVSTIGKETKTLLKNNVRLNAIGDLNSLPGDCKNELEEAMAKTSENTGLTLNLALSYSSRWDITNATKLISQKVASGELKAEDINQETVAAHLSTNGVPDPELVIRTSGEFRISNYLLWEIAYAELFFSPVLWPDFRRDELYRAVIDFQNRERRFGKTSEQISNKN
ncbi:MAG: undecaprenyl diphosphate synthase [Sphingobacteriales bacterium]|jgi:undecaprenyl diphosphate synthase